jgi:histidyl-tRNA synthetase
MKHTRPKGTKDFVPPESRRKQWAETEFRRLAELYGFQEIVTPIIEHTELFIKATGETSEIVTKEMYTFKDRSDRSITLRPEGTPGVARAVLENNLRRPCRLYYIGPMFRYNRPQKGRFREFYQLGVECLGEADPGSDAEVIALGYEFFRALGISDCETQINSIGCRGGGEGELAHPAHQCRIAYHEQLRGYLAGLSAQLCVACQVRAEQNPLRVFDCKEASCQELLAGAPRSKDNLCPACAEHFAGVQAALRARGVPFAINDRMVRGLDYYSRTAFEYVSRSIGAQDSLGGGGRYDYLIEDFGGPHVPAIGFALGEERALLAAQPNCDFGGRLVFVVALSANEQSAGLALLAELRAAGIPAQMDFDHAQVKQQFRAADNAGAQYCLILGENEIARGTVSMKDLATGEQQEIKRGDLIGRLKVS